MKKYTYDEIDSMNIEELESIVSADAQLSASEQLDDDTLLYMLQRIEDSGKYAENFSGTESARETFLDVYHITKDSRTARFGKIIKNTRGLRTACIAVLLLIFFCLGGVTAEAAKFGGAKSKIRWDDEYFSFKGIEGRVQGVPAAGDFDTLPILEPYQKMIINKSSMTDVMVTYLPGEYYVMNYIYSEGNQSYELKLELYKMFDPDEKIILWYNNPQFTGTGYEYPKDAGRPEEYKLNGITHYIMTNEGKWQALWTNGTIECCISGVQTKEELITMIKSIYVRNIDEE